MKCPMKDCHGETEKREITHTFIRRGQPIVIEGIPAHVCVICGYTILDLEILDRLLASILMWNGPTVWRPFIACLANPFLFSLPNGFRGQQLPRFLKFSEMFHINLGPGSLGIVVSVPETFSRGTHQAIDSVPISLL